MSELMEAYSARFGELYRTLLKSLGEPALAADHHADQRLHTQRMIRGAQALAYRGDPKPGSWSVSFVAPEECAASGAGRAGGGRLLEEVRGHAGRTT